MSTLEDNYTLNTPSIEEMFLTGYSNPTMSNFNEFIANMQKGFESEIANLISEFPEKEQMFLDVKNKGPITEQAEIKQAIELKLGAPLIN